MRAYKLHQIEVIHPDQDDLVTEPVPGNSSRHRLVYMLVRVGYGEGRYNFALALPKDGPPEHILLGDRLLTKLPYDPEQVEGQPNYAETKIRAVVARGATPVTFPDRAGPARPMFDWDHPEET